MTRHGGDSGGDDHIAKQPAAESFKIDMRDYQSAERHGTAGDVQTSGQRLQDAALKYEQTMQQTPFVQDLADRIKTGTPGTKEWDDLMVQVEKQLNSNNQQVKDIQTRTSQIPDQIAKANTANTHLPDVTFI